MFQHPVVSAGPDAHTRPPRQGLNLLRRAAVRRAGSKGAPMKLPRTVGLAVAVSLVVATVAAARAWISGAAPAGPTANVVDAVTGQAPAPRRAVREARLRCSTSAFGN
jgi:hypothetical protein